MSTKNGGRGGVVINTASIGGFGHNIVVDVNYNLFQPLFLFPLCLFITPQSTLSLHFVLEM